uniref:SCP domain-containing protein n=1 Tax=Parastrongyloides trichosuri TaxID=131310 RepID=A0A0N4Z4R2_PARTI
MCDNNYECLFNVSHVDGPGGPTAGNKTKKLEPNIGGNEIKPNSPTQPINFNSPDYFGLPSSPTPTPTPVIAKGSKGSLPNDTTKLQAPQKTNRNSIRSSAPVVQLTNENALTQEQIDQIEKILPNGTRTPLYMYYYNYYVKMRPGRNKDYYENLVQHYVNICKERLARLKEDKELENNHISSREDIPLGPKFTARDPVLGNLFYWFGINKLNRSLKWYDSTFEKDQNFLNKEFTTYYRRNTYLKKNWSYQPDETFKYIATSFEPHSLVMATINQNSFTMFAISCGYKVGTKKVFLEYAIAP